MHLKVRSLTLLLAALVSILPLGHANDSKRPQPSFSTRDASGKSLDASRSQLDLLLEKINGLEHFIRAEKSPARLAGLRLNRATTLTQAARLTLLIEPDGASKSRKMFLSSQEELDAFRGIAGVPASAYDDFFITRGLNSMYLGDEKAASADFESVIVRNPKIENAGWYALFLVEHSFDSGQYERCLRYQSRFETLFTSDQKHLSLYKKAWSFLNLGQPDEAIKTLIGLSKDKGSIVGQSNILRDIAFILSTYNEPSSVLAAVRSLEGRDSKIETLRQLEAILSSAQNKALYRPVTSELSALISSKSERFRLALGNLRMERTFYYGESTDNVFRELLSRIKKDDLEATDKELKELMSPFEIELRLVIGTIIDTYNGKAKPPIKIEKPWLSERLNVASQLYWDWFPKSEFAGQILANQATICVENENWECAIEARRIALASSVLKPSEVEQSELAGVVGLQKTAKPEDYSVALSGFLVRHPQSKKWLELAKTLVSLQIEREKGREVVKLQEEIYQREPSSENLEALLTNLFSQKNFKEVVEAPEFHRDSRRTTQITALRRDASLRLAERAKGRNEIDEYEKWLNKFYSLNPSPSQVDAARMDQLETLHREKRYSDLLDRVLAAPVELRKRPESLKFVRQSWETLFERGEFRKSRELIQNIESTEDLRLLTEVAEQEKLPSYFLSPEAKPTTAAAQFVIALGKPRAFPLNETAADQNALSLARSLIGEIDPAVLVDRELKDFRSEIASIRGEREKKPERYLELVRGSRENLVTQLKNKSLESRIKALEDVQRLESETANWIRASEKPSSLTEEESRLYIDKLNAAAMEFDESARAYGETLASLKSELAKKNTNEGTTHAHPGSMRKWKWPQVRDAKIDQSLQSLIQQKRAIAVLLIADILRDSGKLVETDYYRLWTGAILLMPESRVRRELLMRELKKQRQEIVLEEWRTL